MLHAEFLKALERARKLDAPLVADELSGFTEVFLARRWIVIDGYQTSLLAPVLDTEEEVDVVIDEDAGTFSYRSCGCRNRQITRSLSEITLYAPNVNAWLDELTQIFGIETARRARNRELIEAHLWHLGDLRIGRTHQFAPVYVARRLGQCASDWRAALCDRLRPSQGLVLTAATDADLVLPNSHQACELARLLSGNAESVRCNGEVLDRLLQGVPANADQGEEYFDERTGMLKLAHMDEAKTFAEGYQRAVIALYWKARHQHSVKWSDARTRTNCGRDPDSVFGKGVWREWLENVGHGLYRIRSRRTP